MESCPVLTDDATRMADRVEAFLVDRSSESVLGPRRFGRTPTVEYVVGTARSMMLEAMDTLWPTSPFMAWRMLEVMETEED